MCINTYYFAMCKMSILSVRAGCDCIHLQCTQEAEAGGLGTQGQIEQQGKSLSQRRKQK